MDKLGTLETTNKLLLLLTIPVVVFILKELSFIFIPLVLACFLVLLFMPMIRWANRKSIPKVVTIIVVFVLLFILLRMCMLLLSMASEEFRTTDPTIVDKTINGFMNFVYELAAVVGTSKEAVNELFAQYGSSSFLMGFAGDVFNSVKQAGTTIFMSLFFMTLLLASSFNAQKILQVFVFSHKVSSMRTYITIEKSITKFIIVKIIISFFTGLSFSILCCCFDINFMIFWGVLAFLLNFIQMFGSIVATALMCLFALTQLSGLSTIITFILIAIAIQIIFGSILEPIFQGKTFSINIVTIMIMLLFWGYVWGVVGVVLAVPLTVLIKTILERFENTKKIASLMS